MSTVYFLIWLFSVSGAAPVYAPAPEPVQIEVSHPGRDGARSAVPVASTKEQFRSEKWFRRF